jgi:hypothetical protein
MSVVGMNRVKAVEKELKVMRSFLNTFHLGVLHGHIDIDNMSWIELSELVKEVTKNW